MAYPDTIPAFRDALLAYAPVEDHAEAIYDAQAQASPVVQAVRVFETLKAVPDLTQDGLALLLGAAHLIAAGGWHGLAGEAATVLASRAPELAAPEPEA
jgi:hypothetical protein